MSAKTKTLDLGTVDGARAFIRHCARTADQIVHETGVLNFDADRGIDDAVLALDPSGEATLNGLLRVEPPLGEQLDEIDAAVTSRARIAYLLGLAVGQRIGGAR